jgi:hypothetical protein
MSGNRRAAATQVPTSDRSLIPYRPSWFDRVKNWVERLPGPPWLFYLGLAVVLGVVGPVVQWLEGAYPPGTFVALHAWAFANGAYLLAFMHYTDRSASAAIRAARPILHAEPIQGETSPIDEATFSRLEYELTTLPARPVLAATIGGVLFALLAYVPQSGAGSIPKLMVGTAQTPLSFAIVLALFLPSNAISILFLYHSVHQLRHISRVYEHHVHINLYRLGPLYGLAVPGVLAAVALILYPYIWWATAATTIHEIVAFEIGDIIVVSAIAVAIFVAPLWGAHRRIVAEKDGHLSEAALRFEAATAELHRQLDKGSLSEMDQLNKALASLEIEQAALKRIPTWPWASDTSRSLLAAILLPVAVWLLQLLLGCLIGP